MDERRFHDWLARSSRPGDAGILPVGDDVAALRSGPGLLLLTTDAFSEGTHFRAESPPAAIGRALVEANLSDLASKGARPVAFLLDLLVPPETDPAWARAVVRGVRSALRARGLGLSGGDTKPARTRVLVGTAVGTSRRRRLPRRDGARPGDLVATTGLVGRGGAAALALRGDGPISAAAARALLRIRARLAEGAALAPYARAMLDTSDGLFEGARLLARASRVAVLLEPGRLPLVPALRRTPVRRRLATAGFGGDYELLLTLPRDRLAAARRALAATGTPLTVVGRIAPGAGAWWAEGATRRLLPRAGWDPFRPAPP